MESTYRYVVQALMDFGDDHLSMLILFPSFNCLHQSRIFSSMKGSHDLSAVSENA